MKNYIIVWLTIFLVSSSSCDLYAREMRTALVIGISNYDGDKISRLKNPANDAEDLSATLSALGFDVTLLTDPTKNEIVQASNSFIKHLDVNVVALFYFAGHAIQLPSKREEYQNYMVPAGAIFATVNSKTTDEILRNNLVSLDDIISNMGNANKGINIVILDACRENPFSKILNEPVNGLTRSRGLKVVDISSVGSVRQKKESMTNFFVAYSARYNSVAQDGAGRNSPFTKAILENISKDGTIEELFKLVRASVEKETDNNQLPQEVSSLKNEFYFSKPKVKTVIEKYSRPPAPPF